MSNAFLTSLANLGNTLKVDILAAAGHPIMTSLQSVVTNPTVENVLAQKVVVAGAVLGALPTLESEGIQAVASWLVAEISPAIPAAPASK